MPSFHLKRLPKVILPSILYEKFHSIVVKIEWYILLRTVSHKVKCFVIFNMYFAFQL